MSFIDNIEIDKIRTVLSDIISSVEYVDDFGHVGCYDMTSGEVKKISAEVLILLNNVNTKLESISNAVENSYQY